MTPKQIHEAAYTRAVIHCGDSDTLRRHADYASGFEDGAVYVLHLLLRKPFNEIVDELCEYYNDTRPDPPLGDISQP